MVEGDVVHGLGSADDKGGVVACLLAARDLVAAGEDLERLGVAFAFPVDEERGGSGSRTVALRLRPRRAIALEATGLRVGLAETGDIDAWVHVSGRSAHGALTDEGENAIHAAVRMITALGRLGLDAHTHPLLGVSQAEVGAIRGGTDFNTVPDRCSFQLQTRILPGQDGAATLSGLEALAAEHGGTVEVVEMTEPFETPADSPLALALADATAQVAGAGTGADRGPRLDRRPQHGRLRRRRGGRLRARRLQRGAPAGGADRRQRGGRVRRGLRPGGAAGAQLGLTPASAATAASVSTAVSICAASSAAETWIRTLAVPSGTTG